MMKPWIRGGLALLAVPVALAQQPQQPSLRRGISETGLEGYTADMVVAPHGYLTTFSVEEIVGDTREVQVYATERGARSSRHYEGVAVDFVALDLPRSLALEAPDGVRREFDLSGPEEPRDLSVSPELIDWIETHFALEKLRSDYPHWNDARGD